MRFVLIILSLFGAVALAEPSFLGSDQWQRPGPTQPDYAAPTEHNQGESLVIVKEAPRGVYVTVGNERAFVGAALTPNADHLLVLDRSQNTLDMIRYNAGLLALSRDRADYLFLRLQAKQEEIVERAKEASIPADYLRAIRSQHVAERYRNRVRGKNYASNFDLLNLPPPADPSAEYGYKDANYLYDDRLFNKLHEMARAGRISALEVDLGEADQVRAVVEKLAAKNVGLSVLDVSDTWYFSTRQSVSFLSPPKSIELWKSFGTIAKPESVLLFTAWEQLHQRKPDPRKARLEFWPWIYFGMTFKSVANGNAEKNLVNMVRYYHYRGGGNPKWAGQLDGELESVIANPPCPFSSVAPGAYEGPRPETSSF